MNTYEELLKKHFGYSSFRPLQQEVITDIVNGKDVLALFPTGSGKSLLYQIAGMALPGVTVIVSPLLSLMKDQLKSVRKAGMIGDTINSEKTENEIVQVFNNIKYGNTKFIFVSPERFESPLFMRLLEETNLALFAIDEAHCISMWGHDFRPAYLNLKLLKNLYPQVPILALTATATEKVKQDILKTLNTHDAISYQKSFARENIDILIYDIDNKKKQLTELINDYISESTIVYCRTRKQVEETAYLLNQNQIPAQFYHAGLNAKERKKRQEDWFADKFRCMVSTNAFGMGIDKSNVRLVVHYEMPDSIENYYQEIGRAGRDGNMSKAVLLYNASDILSMQKRLAKAFPDPALVKTFYKKLMQYLNIAYEEGEGLIRPFAFHSFCKESGTSISQAYYALKVLENDGWIRFSENLNHISTVRIFLERRALEQKLEDGSVESEVLSSLLRSYEGLFFSNARIEEKFIANKLGLELQHTKNALQKLNAQNFIQYREYKVGPQIQILKPRVRQEFFNIDIKQYLAKKTESQRKQNRMLSFVQEKSKCRQQIILEYFDEMDAKACGICGNCKRAQNENTSLDDRIWEYISVKETSIFDLVKEFGEENKTDILEILKNWEDANRISISKNSTVHIH